MNARYYETYFTPDVLASQDHYYGRSRARVSSEAPDPLGSSEADFIALRDSFYMATVTSDGWPYVQHRGGPRGFLRVLDPQTLGFADLRGNRQLISTGNLAGSSKLALFLMDYPNRTRLKIAGHARVLDARENAALAETLSPSPEQSGRIERLILIGVESYDWNCPQYITPRFSEDEIREAVAPLHERIAKLEAELASHKE